MTEEVHQTPVSQADMGFDVSQGVVNILKYVNKVGVRAIEGDWWCTTKASSCFQDGGVQDMHIEIR